LDLLDAFFQLLILLAILFLFFFFADNGLVFVHDFFFQVRNLLSHASELLFELLDLFLGVQEVFGIEVSV